MSLHRQELVVSTSRRSSVDITDRLRAIVAASEVSDGLCNIFLRHTSASLIITENADPSVRRDLEGFLGRLAPDGAAEYEHDAEGPDDMAAHIRTALTQSSISVPVVGGMFALGTWQGVFLWEHRHSGHQRRLLVTVMGE